MAKAKKEIKVKEEVKEEKKTKIASKKADQVVIDEAANTEISQKMDFGTVDNTELPKPIVTGGKAGLIKKDELAEYLSDPYTRATPFGVEVWNPETKSTSFKTNA
ncbi:hypothetical protein MM783_000566 [Enterococcus faecalis]|nr:hypothetical protein [Enterococcus faecalis]